MSFIDRWTLGIAAIMLAIAGALGATIIIHDAETDAERHAREVVEEYCDAVTYGREAYEDCIWEAERR